MRFVAGAEVVSASTDSTLRLWDARALAPARTFSGHTNEKNFVGLSVDQDFIACGSETNEARGPALAGDKLQEGVASPSAVLGIA